MIEFAKVGKWRHWYGFPAEAGSFAFLDPALCYPETHVVIHLNTGGPTTTRVPFTVYLVNRANDKRQHYIIGDGPAPQGIKTFRTLTAAKRAGEAMALDPAYLLLVGITVDPLG